MGNLRALGASWCTLRYFLSVLSDTIMQPQGIAKGHEVKNKTKLEFYSGTSGLVLPFSKRSFPAEFKDKSRLHYYASLFNSIEINSSFYKMPMASTIKRWGESVPDGFR